MHLVLVLHRQWSVVDVKPSYTSVTTIQTHVSSQQQNSLLLIYITLQVPLRNFIELSEEPLFQSKEIYHKYICRLLYTILDYKGNVPVFINLL